MRKLSSLYVRIQKDRIAFILICIFSLTSMIPLFLIIWELLKKGYKQFNLNLFTEVAPSSTDALFAKANGDIIPGGISNGITGMLLIVFLAIFMAVPIGMIVGVFLMDKKDTLLAKIVRFLSELLQGIPSIVIGISVYILVVKPLHSYSAFAGSVTLAIMMLPMIIKSTEESLCMLPNSLKESALALGAPYSIVVLRILIPSALSGIFTGTLLAISRVMGETAPLLVTALGASAVNWDISRPTSSISLLIWEFYNDPNLVNMVWSSSLLLLFMVLGINLIAKKIAKKWKIQ